jgi:diguanylate cyclase (GGDEF)-like protein
MKKVLLRPLLLPNPFERSSNDFWRVRLFNTYLVLTLLVFGFFAIYNFGVVKLYANGTADLVGLLLGLVTVVEYRMNQKVERTSWFVVLNVALLTLTIIMISAKDFGILMWSVFTPIFAFFLLGLRRGMQVTLVFYAALLVHLYSVLGTQINTHLMVEFVAVSMALGGVIYFYELNREVTYALIQRAALEDALTGLYNRRWFNNRFESEYQRARRDERTFYFFIMDIDRFKHYNDTNGHDKGDAVLRQIAAVMADNMRRGGDEAFRLGGEEFGGIISSGTQEEVIAHVEKIRRDIEALEIEISPGSGLVVTASFGLSATAPDDRIKATEVYRLTDQALYRAKENGRNRVELETIKLDIQAAPKRA